MPARTASSTTSWIAGVSTMGIIAFGCAFVAGRKRVPRPAAGMTPLRTFACPLVPTDRERYASMHDRASPRPA